MQNDYYQEEDLKGSLDSYEQSIKYKKYRYFEVHEFEFIIDYYISLGDVLNSKGAIQRALSIHPKNHELQKRLAQVNNIDGLFENAVGILENAFTSFGIEKDIDYYLILGEAFLGKQEYKKAKKAFDNAIKLSGEEHFEIVGAVASLYQQEGLFEDVVYYLKSIEEEDSSLLFDIAIAYHSILDYENCIVYLNRFILIVPFSVEAWYYLSKSYQASAQLVLAEDALLNAIAINPEDLSYQYNLANLLVDQFKYIDALILYKEILEQDKEVEYSIYISIGNICYNLEKYREATENYKIALRLNPESHDAYHSLGQVEIESENYGEAIEYIVKAISITEERADYYISLGTAYQLIGDHSGSEICFKKAVEINPGLQTAWNLLIDFYYFSDKPRKAIEIAFNAIKELGKTYQNFCKISAAYFDLKETTEAMYYLKEALDLSSDSSSFFIEYYPEALDNRLIMNLIKQ